MRNGNAGVNGKYLRRSIGWERAQYGTNTKVTFHSLERRKHAGTGGARRRDDADCVVVTQDLAQATQALARACSDAFAVPARELQPSGNFNGTPCRVRTHSSEQCIPGRKDASDHVNTLASAADTAGSTAL